MICKGIDIKMTHLCPCIQAYGTHAFACIYTSVHCGPHTCSYTYICLCTNIHPCTYIHLCTFIHPSTYIHLCTYICLRNTSTHAHTYAHALHPLMHIHTPMHIHIVNGCRGGPAVAQHSLSVPVCSLLVAKGLHGCKWPHITAYSDSVVINKSVPCA